MTAGRYGGSVDNHLYLAPPDIGVYDGTSSESSASSPLNGNVNWNGGRETMPGLGTNTPNNLYGTNGFLNYQNFPVQYPLNPDGLAPVAMIPVELDIDSLYEDHDRRRRKNTSGSEKPVSSHVHSRRRAQNRASQRAFRDRKEKHTRELEQRLSELEGQHNDLSRSYESLQLEYTSVKQELDRLRKEREEPAHSAQTREWDGKEGGALDPVLFDVSAFCFDHGEETCQKEC